MLWHGGHVSPEDRLCVILCADLLLAPGHSVTQQEERPSNARCVTVWPRSVPAHWYDIVLSLAGQESIRDQREVRDV